MKRREIEILVALREAVERVRNIRNEMDDERRDLRTDMAQVEYEYQREPLIRIEPQLTVALYELDDGLDYMLSALDHTEEYYK